VIVRGLAVIAALLIFASICGQFSRFYLGHPYVKGIVPLFYLDQEQNIPTYYSVLLMLSTALMLGTITILQKRAGAPHIVNWAVLTIGMMFMAYDEAFQVHEELIDPMRALLGDGNLGIFYFAWVIPALGLVAALGLLFLRFLRDLSAATRNRFLLAACLLVGGACGVELAGGYYAELYGTDTWVYSMLATLEEALEMAGLIMFLHALFKFCADNYQELRFRF
jgi:hypothetical protein